jgi:hypothetical protein
MWGLERATQREEREERERERERDCFRNQDPRLFGKGAQPQPSDKVFWHRVGEGPTLTAPASQISVGGGNANARQT